MMKSLTTTPSTTRSSSICTVTRSRIGFDDATMSPKPTVAKQVTAKYSAPVLSRTSVNDAGVAQRAER